MPHPICVGITGASGAIYAVRLLEVLRGAGRDVHLSISSSGRDVILQELGLRVDLDAFDTAALLPPGGTALESKIPLLKASGETSSGSKTTAGEPPGLSRRDEPAGSPGFETTSKPVPASQQVAAPGRLQYYHHQDFMAPMASGSFLTGGMVICPASGTTLSAVATGAASNLIQRAAEVHLKERRKLVLVPREAPLSLAHIDNMRRVTEAGAVVIPASPGWYHGVRSIRDLVDFVVARICDQLDVEHALTKRWGKE